MKLPYNPITNKEYEGGNQKFLSIVAKKYDSELFAGYKQWNELGLNVKKGEKGYKILIVFTKDDEKKVTQKTVFNFKQTEKIKED